MGVKRGKGGGGWGLLSLGGGECESCKRLERRLTSCVLPGAMGGGETWFMVASPPGDQEMIVTSTTTSIFWPDGVVVVTLTGCADMVLEPIISAAMAPARHIERSDRNENIVETSFIWVKCNDGKKNPVLRQTQRILLTKKISNEGLP